MHPEESRRRIATGRLTHRLLPTSYLFTAESFENHLPVQVLLNDPQRECVVLYPGRHAVDIAQTPPTTPSNKTRTVFVLDGTWRNAKKMLRLSPRLSELQQICFTPPRLSTFRIRKQPRPDCFSTLEAVHYMLGYFEPGLTERSHLIEMFDLMVERQIQYAAKARVARMKAPKP